jgi:outer membrane protein TolC
MNLPLWRKSYRAAELQAEANMRRARQRKTQTENTIIAHAERALYDFDDSARKIKLYGDILIPKAEELLNVSETAYKGGTLDFLSLIDAQRTFLEYELNHERAVTDNLQSLAQLEMLAGAELTTVVKEGEGL